MSVTSPADRRSRSAPTRIHRRLQVRFGITWKMFLAVLAACLVISSTMSYAIHVSFENGFLHYVRERDAGRLKAVLARVSAEYALHGSWDFLRHRPADWLALLSAATRDAQRAEFDSAQATRQPVWRVFPGSMEVQQLLTPTSGQGEGSPWGMRLPSMPPAASQLIVPRDKVLSRDHSYPLAPAHASLDYGTGAEHPPVGPPVALMDANHELVANSGQEAPGPGSASRGVFVNGKLVGWIVVSGLGTLSDAADIAFQAQQVRASWQIAGVAVVLAAIVALLLARVVLAPVKRLTDATHSLAGGDYSARVPVTRRDELGWLASDFNVLANSLERAERARRDLIADISHELRTPLAVLRGELEAIEDGVHDFNRQSLRSLHSEVSMLNKLIDDLYELSLSDVGALSYSKAPTPVADVSRQSVDAMRESFKAKCIAIEYSCTPTMADARFAVDSARFTQLLKNLLQNSLRYTDPGGRVEVTLSETPLCWKLQVRDSAPGVPDAALIHLFDRFYRVDESRSRQGGGAGLGLSLCRAIVTAHGGTIDAASSPLGGLSVTACFPIGGE